MFAAPLPDNLVETINYQESTQPSNSLAKVKCKEGNALKSILFRQPLPSFLHCCPPNQLSFELAGTSSQYVGVAVKKSSGLYRAAIKVKGFTHDLGYYKEEESAARAYDMACICVRGLVDGKINFPVTDYSLHAEMLSSMAIDDLAKQLRTQAGATGTRQEKTTQYQGIRAKQYGGCGGKWEAIIRVAGRSIYLGMYDTDKEAAQAYDQAAILRWAQGVGATSHADSSTMHPSLNFPLESYKHLIVLGLDSDTGIEQQKEAITSSSSLPIENVVGTPALLGKRYAEAVLQVCRQFLATSETLKNALA